MVMPKSKQLFYQSEDQDEKDLVKNEAHCLHNKMSLLDIAVYTQFWHEILERFDATSQYLQNSTTTLKPAVNSILSLIDYVETKRAKFEEFVKIGKEMSGAENFRHVRSRVKSVRLNAPGCSKQTETISERTPVDKFKTDAIYPVIDQLKASLAERAAAYKQVILLKFKLLTY